MPAHRFLLFFASADLRRLAGPDPAIVAGAFLWSSQSFSNL
jgi:hypothetical protein